MTLPKNLDPCWGEISWSSGDRGSFARMSGKTSNSPTRRQVVSRPPFDSGLNPRESARAAFEDGRWRGSIRARIEIMFSSPSDVTDLEELLA